MDGRAQGGIVRNLQPERGALPPIGASHQSHKRLYQKILD